MRPECKNCGEDLFEFGLRFEEGSPESEGYCSQECLDMNCDPTPVDGDVE